MTTPSVRDLLNGRLAVRQMVVHVPVGHLRLLSDACLLRERADLLLRETVEYLSRLPHVDDPDPVVGLGSPVEDCSRRDVSGSKAHQLDDLVVLLGGCALEVHLDRDWHRVSLVVYAVQPTPLHVEMSAAVGGSRAPVAVWSARESSRTDMTCSLEGHSRHWAGHIATPLWRSTRAHALRG